MADRNLYCPSYPWLLPHRCLKISICQLTIYLSISICWVTTLGPCCNSTDNHSHFFLASARVLTLKKLVALSLYQRMPKECKKYRSFLNLAPTFLSRRFMDSRLEAPDFRHLITLTCYVFEPCNMLNFLLIFCVVLRYFKKKSSLIILLKPHCRSFNHGCAGPAKLVLFPPPTPRTGKASVGKFRKRPSPLHRSFLVYLA